MNKLVPMTQGEFNQYFEALIPDYGADNVRVGYWSKDGK